MLFGEGERGPDLLLTERAHDMRSHPGQVSFPGGSIDRDDDNPEETALREAEEETGLDPAGVQVFGAAAASCGCRRATSRSRRCSAGGARRARCESSTPARCTRSTACTIDELLDPAHRISVRHPSGWKGPAFLIGDDKDLILWGFTAGIIARLFDYLGWTRPWDPDVMRDLPDHMLAPRADLPGRRAA